MISTISFSIPNSSSTLLCFKSTSSLEASIIAVFIDSREKFLDWVMSLLIIKSYLIPILSFIILWLYPLSKYSLALRISRSCLLIIYNIICTATCDSISLLRLSTDFFISFWAILSTNTNMLL